MLSEYLQTHPGIRQDVHERLRRVPDESPDCWPGFEAFCEGT